VTVDRKETRLKTVLFAWELGIGRGHLEMIRLMAARLRARGFRTVAAIPDPAAATALRDSCAEVMPAPAWPLASQTEAQRARRSSATLNDILSSAGMADALAVRRLLAEWDRILQEVRPDLVVAEFAPMAALAARRRFPLVVVGTGYTLPPSDMPRFPPLHRASRPVWSEEATLEAVNSAARALGRAPLERLPQLFSGDLCRVLTIDLFDPYDVQRVNEVDGPLVESAVGECRDDAELIFAYLSGGADIPAGLVEALSPFGSRVHLHAPRLDAEQRNRLIASGVQIHRDPVALSDLLPSCRLTIHVGGHGLACHALLAGVPQLVLSGHIEQTLNGQALERAGVGRLIETYRAETAISAALIEELAGVDGMARRARELARHYRGKLSGRDPRSRVEDACLVLLAS
jgi:UDP:flavonoid glycosyltransferase YjiC (YdhE family)